MKIIGSHSCHSRSANPMISEGGCNHLPVNGQHVEEKVMFVFGSVLFVALMAYGAALNVLLGADVEDTFI